MTTFDRAMAVVFAQEGEHSNDPGDFGGDTWFGLARKFHPEVNPWPPTKEQAIEVYRAQYWDRFHCGELPDALAIGFFDAVVNQPAVSMVEELQRVLRSDPDGIMGHDTIEAAKRKDEWEVLALFFARRARRYVQRSDERYQVGLLARLFRVHRAILGSAV